MANKMLIDCTHPEETRVVVVRGNRVEEFDFESANRRQLRGNIYLAKVTRVEPSLQAAFVEYGGNRHGFLAFSEIHPDYYQIPVADRQALLDEEERQHREAEEEADRRSTAAVVVVADVTVIAATAPRVRAATSKRGPRIDERRTRPTTTTKTVTPTMRRGSIITAKPRTTIRRRTTRLTFRLTRSASRRRPITPTTCKACPPAPMREPQAPAWHGEPNVVTLGDSSRSRTRSGRAEDASGTLRQGRRDPQAVRRRACRQGGRRRRASFRGRTFLRE